MADEYEDDLIWEAAMHDAVREMLCDAVWDSAQRQVTLSRRAARGEDSKVTVDTLTALQHELVEEGNAAWYSTVPFERGEAIFEDTTDDFVRELLWDSYQPQLQAFGWDR